MNWRNLFKSSHTLWLETQVVELKAEHAKQIADLKKTHGEQLAYAIKQADKLRDDLDRTRLLLNPALQSVTLKHEQDSSPPPPPSEIEGGTPWMRFRAKAIAEQEVAAKPKNYVKPASTPVEGENHGGNGEGRVETPLGK